MVIGFVHDKMTVEVDRYSAFRCYLILCNCLKSGVPYYFSFGTFVGVFWFFLF